LTRTALRVRDAAERAWRDEYGSRSCNRASDAPPPTGALTPLTIAQALSAALPENCILVDESLTTGRETMGLTRWRRAA
jgi:hypothetical protein